jgi:hypothetical protein
MHLTDDQIIAKKLIEKELTHPNVDQNVKTTLLLVDIMNCELLFIYYAS